MTKPVKRLWSSSLAAAAIKKAFLSLKDGEETKPLFYSAYSRSVADYYVGLSATRALSIQMKNSKGTEKMKNQGTWSVGRIQTPLIRIICDREQEILNFKSEPFWTIQAQFNIGGTKYTGKWKDLKNNIDQFNTKDAAALIVSKVKGKGAIAEKVTEDIVKIKPPQFYNLSDLQIRANKLYKMSSKAVLDAGQALYEASYISYVRTDSNYVTDAEINEFPEIIKGLSQIGMYREFTQKIIEPGKLKHLSRYQNNKKVSDHHAILPTGVIPDFSKLNENQKKIYDLIVRSVIAAHYEDAEVSQTTIITNVNQERFITSGKVSKIEGWRDVIHEEKSTSKEKDNNHESIPILDEGSRGITDKVSIKEGKTKPKKRYTQGDLISVMKNCGRNVEDKALAKSLNSTEGLGTEATRSSIIENIFAKGYIICKNNVVYPTPKATMLIEALGRESIIASPIMTARWEQALKAIAEGDYDYNHFIKQSKELAKKLCESIGLRSKTWNFDAEIAQIEEMKKIGECPNCGSDIVEHEKFYGCRGYSEKQCSFSVQKVIAKKKISSAQVKKLLKDKKTDIIKGFKSSKGEKTFDTFLYYDSEKKCIDWGFNQVGNDNKPPSKDTGFKCPLCKNNLVEHQKFIGCSGFKNGCEFKISKNICGVNLTSTHIEELVNNGETSMIDGFVFKDKTFRKALCVIDGKVMFKK